MRSLVIAIYSADSIRFRSSKDSRSFGSSALAIFHVLQGDDRTRYMSTGGSLNPQQPALLRGAMEKLPPGGLVLLAFDADEGGEKLTEEVRAFAPSGREVRRFAPQDRKDWNEILKWKAGLT